MSADVQPRKRKDKRRRRDDDDSVPGTPEKLRGSIAPDVQMHIEQENETGGHWCAKIVFFVLMAILLGLVALIVLENRGQNEVETVTSDSKFAEYFEGWVEEHKDHDEDHGHYDAPLSEEVDDHDDDGDGHDDHGQQGDKEDEIDTDGDGIPDIYDDDDDGNGIPDDEEVDTDGDGIPDIIDEDDDGNGVPDKDEVDTDGDGIPDILDEDDDNNGIPDVDEIDTDNDGIPDVYDDDDDGNGIPDAEEKDTDGDGIPDHIDDDDDNDGIPDVYDDDDDGNGIPDSQEKDTDGDGIPDHIDDDDDNDGIPDIHDDDADGDGVPDKKEKAAPKAESKPSKQKKRSEKPKNLAIGDAPFEEEDLEESVEQILDNDLGEEIFLRKLKEKEEAKKKPVRDPRLSQDPKKEGSSEQETKKPVVEDDDDDDDDLNEAENNLTQQPKASLKMFEKILKYKPNSIKALYGKVRALDKLSKVYRSNEMLTEAVEICEQLISSPAFEKKLVVDNPQLYIEIGNMCIDRMRFLGLYKRAVIIQKYLVKNFPDDPNHRNQLAILLIMSSRLPEARDILHETLLKWRYNGVALVHYGFVLKQLDTDLEQAIMYLQEGIDTNENGTQDGLFYLTLGDSLNRVGKVKEAQEIFKRGAVKGLFMNPYQRSLYNVNRLKSKPFWTEAETKSRVHLQALQNDWQEIRDEGIKILTELRSFVNESENLREKGDWKQFELFARGQKKTENCKKAPITCNLLDSFETAITCSRGQIKFSVLMPGTHVWPHTGPTNCRIRAHLGLIVPLGTSLRVVNETRSWKEGEWLIFDDSFEHEVWHNGTSLRLVLIVDVWHPDLTADERKSLPPI